jgi:hypothetical protein
MSNRCLVLVLGALLLPLAAPRAQTPPAAPGGPPRNASDTRPSTDPRDVKDPRDVGDPRDSSDPRTVKDPYETLEGKDLYEALYAAGEFGRLKSALHDDGWQVLPYIDSHCEGWLAMLERGAGDSEQGRKELADMQAKGRRLADLADAALGDTRFTVYVSNFYGWTPEQQKSFREGQSLYHDGEKLLSTATSPDEAKRALTPLQQSYERARPLGDTWGQSMALALMSRVQADNGMEKESRETAREAERVGREIRDLGSVWTALSVTFESAVGTREYEPARDSLQNQYLIAKALNDDETADKVLRQLVDLNISFNMPMAPMPGEDVGKPGVPAPAGEAGEPGQPAPAGQPEHPEPPKVPPGMPKG